MSKQTSLFPHQKLELRINRLESQLQNRQVNDPAVRLELARVTLSIGLFHKGGEVSCARSLGQAKKVLREDPSSVEALAIAGLALIGMNRPDDARRHIDKALSLDVEQAELQLAASYLARAEGRFNDMIKHMEKACKLKPTAWEPHLFLGGTLLAMGRKQSNRRAIERAEYHLVQALKNDNSGEKNFELVRDLGISCLLNGHVKEAEKFFNRLRTNPKYEGVARFHLGQVAYRLGKYNNAINHFRQYLSYKSDDANVLARMALSWFQLGEYSRAREACNQALQLERYHLMARHVLGCSALEEGNPNEALRIFRETLKEHPEHMPSYVEFMRILREAGEVRWIYQALQTEVARYDRQPVGGDVDPRLLLRQRIQIILDELRHTGPSSATDILRVIEYTQDESLRFLLWETSCQMVEEYVANETSMSLRSSGNSYCTELGEAAACLGGMIPEHIMTAGLNISEQDLQRAATERYSPAHDVVEHRKNLDKERNEARAYQALLLLGISLKGGKNSQVLLQEWAATSDADMILAAQLGLLIMGRKEVFKEIQKSARSRDKLETLKSLQVSLKPSSTSAIKCRIVTDEKLRCKTCGKNTDQVSHVLAGEKVVICSSCIGDLWQNRADLTAPHGALCDLCGRSHFDVPDIYRFRGVDICSHCIHSSMSFHEQEQIEQYFSGH